MWSKIVVVGLGGFVGANARYLLTIWVQGRWGTAFPYATFAINVTGSFLLGLVGAFVLRQGWSDTWRLLIGVGFVGAYTTFSTFELETVQLLAQGQNGRALFYLFGSVLLGLAAAYAGIGLVQLLPARPHA
jgi:fluoride exporter